MENQVKSQISDSMDISKEVEVKEKKEKKEKKEEKSIEDIIEKADPLNMSRLELVSLVLDTQNLIKKRNSSNKQILEEEKLKKNSGKMKKSKKKIKTMNWDKFGWQQIAFKLTYMGWNHSGLALQTQTQNTVEEIFFRALEHMNLIQSRDQSKLNFTRAGRTDSGVSAIGQVMSVRIRVSKNNLNTFESGVNQSNLISEVRSYVTQLNHVLPDSIRVVSYAVVSNNFNARYDCLLRVYRYVFFGIQDNITMDINLMTTAAKKLEGAHDFRNFCKLSNEQKKNYKRDIESISITKLDSNCPEGLYQFEIRAQSFVWHQIRAIVGVLFLIGKKLEDISIIDTLFDIEKTPARPQYSFAPEIPLVLYDCIYPSDVLIWNPISSPEKIESNKNNKNNNNFNNKEMTLRTMFQIDQNLRKQYELMTVQAYLQKMMFDSFTNNTTISTIQRIPQIEVKNDENNQNNEKKSETSTEKNNVMFKSSTIITENWKTFIPNEMGKALVKYNEKYTKMENLQTCMSYDEKCITQILPLKKD